MTSSRWALRLLPACAALACASRVAGPTPQPLEVLPATGYQDVETPVVIRGNGFSVQAYQDAGGQPRVDTTYRAWLGGVELADVTWVSASELRARIPRGVPAGAQRLEVLAPGGGVGVLDGAFTVLAGAGASLATAATLVPGVAAPGGAVTLTVTVTNPGDVWAKGVAVSSAVSGALTLGAPMPASQDIGPGAAAIFVQQGTAGAAGTASVTIGAAGIDAGTGLPVSAPPFTTGVLVVQADEAVKILDDPFGDGTAFSFVFGYDGHVFLGPGRGGSSVVRCTPDASACDSFGFLFSRDITPPHVSQNTVCPTLTTFGSVATCDAVTPQNTACGCGPDYESGRGVLGSFTLGSPEAEWLVGMGRTEKAGALNYLYMTEDVASPLGFSYADLDVAMPQTAAVTDAVSMAVLGGVLYAGLQVVDADRPRIVALTRTPTAPGLECTSADAFATTLQNTTMGESGTTTGISQVDAMLGFEGRLFVANRRAVLVSKTAFPTGAADASTQFDDCTPPVAGSTWDATSIVKYTGKIDVTPADKGVSGLAEWNGRLFLGRNTRPPPPGTAPAVPELWVFTPRHDPVTGAFLGCAPTDWQRIATNFGAATSTRLTALFASASYLYVGYDDAFGARLFRTSRPAPASEGDFEGHLGCTAPCTPLGTAGLGDPTNTRFMDARAITFAGVDQVWATAGSGSGPVRVFRISE